MRVFAVPILSNRWAYYCHSTIPTTSRLTKFVSWSNNKWDQLGTADPKSWKRKLFDHGNNLMNQLDYQEWFLKGVPTKEHLEQQLEKACVYHPSMLKGPAIQDDLDLLLQHREPYHKKYMYYSAYWVPISCTFVIVPLIPNIPLAYNLFRLYSHYKAYKGAQHLQFLSYHNRLEYTPHEKLDETFNGCSLSSTSDISFPAEVSEAFKQPGSKPRLHILQKDIPGALSLETINELAHELELPALELELKRARFQILCEAAHQRFNNRNKKE
ncbi:hypothetical protein EC973_006696 [Apophysomyces ossiformis]|uniref:Uncharacterized protein n=1 Tax=Apophysomyces ossiformis TaxID=679940 RepID=A0A8H7EUH8_9FUNG|nr:hypothetical protein EC973_006696 [Apophysomyces ossiformis]